MFDTSFQKEAKRKKKKRNQGLFIKNFVCKKGVFKFEQLASYISTFAAEVEVQSLLHHL